MSRCRVKSLTDQKIDAMDSEFFFASIVRSIGRNSVNDTWLESSKRAGFGKSCAVI
jgi:hypothetical protein